MEREIDRMVHAFERGRMTRRQLVTGLATLTAAASAAAASGDGERGSTFRATGLDHIALRVTDVERSRDFYVRHLGLEVANESLPANSFLNCGDDFVALFRGREAGMDHYCYSIDRYDQREAAAKLRGAGLTPSLQGNRIYFPDPDGLTVQLASGDRGP